MPRRKFYHRGSRTFVPPHLSRSPRVHQFSLGALRGSCSIHKGCSRPERIRHEKEKNKGARIIFPARKEEGTRVSSICAPFRICKYGCIDARGCRFYATGRRGPPRYRANPTRPKNLRRRLAYAYAWSVCATSQGVGNNCQLALSVGMRRFLREFRPLERLCPP